MTGTPSRHRSVHRALITGKRRAVRPACGLSRRRWPSMELTTTTDPAKVTCRRHGCR